MRIRKILHMLRDSINTSAAEDSDIKEDSEARAASLLLLLTFNDDSRHALWTTGRLVSPRILGRCATNDDQGAASRETGRSS
jgi:hypothetical protein